jgi:DNA (cytosine-5)-methyltransferase 1
MGSLLRNVRDGKRPTVDPRNRLILPALRLIQSLRPLWVVFENVVGMRNTIILDEENRPRRILEVIESELGPDYSGSAYDVEFADYGVPQRRQRLITIYTRDSRGVEWLRSGGLLVPPATHSKSSTSGLLRWVSVAEALDGFPALDSSSHRLAASPDLPLHHVPVLDPKKYEWLRHTPPGKSAFDNQCVNPKCHFSGNPTHGARRDKHGVNRASTETPLYCASCGELLPRPFAEGPNGTRRIMRGYTSAYKRMRADLPAPTISRNLSFPCGDQKIHPFENRVLSLAEALRLQTVDRFSFSWGPISYRQENGKLKHRGVAPDGLIRMCLAESIPPAFTQALGSHIQRIAAGMAIAADPRSAQLQLL